jgi:3-hydroxybutyryl-CoA dehydrogenase
MTHAAVVGAGTMGNGIAHVFALHGWQVTLVDVGQDILDRAMATIQKNLGRQVGKGKLTQEEAEAAVGRIKPVVEIEAVGESG